VALWEKKKKKKVFHTKKTKRRRCAKDFDVFVPLRALRDFVGRERRRRFFTRRKRRDKGSERI
jgi:hypothetical protein